MMCCQVLGPLSPKIRANLRLKPPTEAFFSFWGLTVSFHSGIVVHMTEQIVQHDVQPNGITPADQAASTVAAPMVERAFRLLDLLSVSEEGLTLSDLAR